MSWRSIPFVKEAVPIAAALLLIAPPVLAGDRVHSPSRAAIASQPAPAPVARAVSQQMTISVAVATPSQPATAPTYVDLRGPDGQVRRFPVEGGRAAIQYRQVVLRPGESLTIHWMAAK
jgi:hypothetical protein